MPEPTHYDTLEVSAQASPEVVRAAYRSLIQRFHPDRRPGDAQAAERAAAITAAYEVLSDPQRRAAYDQALAAGVAQGASAGPRNPSPASSAFSASSAESASSADSAHAPRLRPRATPLRPTPSGLGGSRWLWLALATPVMGGAIWLAFPQPDLQADPQGELVSIRMAFAAGGQPEAKLRELHLRKQALVQRFPELRARVLAEEAQDRRARTLDLFEAPLVVQLDPQRLTIPRLRVVLGSFEAPMLRARLVRQEPRLREEVARSLERADPAQLSGPLAESYLKTIVLGVLAKDLPASAQESYPSTYFESPGRHGVVEVLLPEGFELVPG